MKKFWKGLKVESVNGNKEDTNQVGYDLHQELTTGCQK
jgi:hypothetical protein